MCLQNGGMFFHVTSFTCRSATSGRLLLTPWMNLMRGGGGGFLSTTKDGETWKKTGLLAYNQQVIPKAFYSQESTP